MNRKYTNSLPADFFYKQYDYIILYLSVYVSRTCTYLVELQNSTMLSNGMEAAKLYTQ